MSDQENTTARTSRWPHLWAWVLCCATFPLVWIGGLITTTDAGMAVPDWPGTYGYNLFLYPWQTWFFGPWDLFVEHGHRLFASGVGLITIGLVIAVWRCDERSWLRWLALGALGLVILQGVIGGLRVVLNERLLAMLHGTVGPAFFALTAALVVATSPSWRARGFGWLGLAPLLIYAQIALGATLRHVPEGGHFITFAQHVQAHLWGAGLVTLTAVAIAGSAWLRPTPRPPRVLASLLAAVVLAQASLGVATWVAKYRLPQWAHAAVEAGGPLAYGWEAVAGRGTMRASTAGGWSETLIVTGHSATGSLLLGLATAWALSAPRRDTKEPSGATS